MVDGMGREFAQEAGRLVKGLRPAPGSKGRLAVKISIPDDHPMAKELLELATLLANRQELASGLKIVRPGVPNADDRMLVLLERMGVPTAQILKDVGAAAPGTDPLMTLGLGLVHAAAAITGTPQVDLAALAEELRRKKS